tara:strand:- start:2822 stop:3079 length:258 start_codon:yes stop_codon:yes gene_type:complete
MDDSVMKKSAVHIGISGSISVVLMEKICKAVRERCGDVATVELEEDVMGHRIYISGVEEVGDYHATLYGKEVAANVEATFKRGGK